MLIPYELNFDINTILHVSHQATNQPPFQNDKETYAYRYIEDYVPTENPWDDEDCYNFTPYEQDDQFGWNKILEKGTYNTFFTLYCLWFPLEYTIRSEVNESGAINYSVMKDQSELDDLMRSDILGAYHTTKNIFSKLQFRLFHLMTYLRIRLYVPVYDDNKNTGFRDNALQYATLDNVTPYFAIDWNVNRSSDEQGPVVSALSGDGSIKMYLHPQEQREIESLEYKKYLPATGYPDQGIDGDFDEVRAYDFSVIIPKQKGTEEDGKENNFADTEFINFYLRSNSGSTTRYYFKQSLSGSANNSSLELEQGVFQYIELYVPRVGNQVVFVGAAVNPWNQMTTDMILKKQQ